VPLEYSRGFAETEDSANSFNYGGRLIIVGHRLQNIYRGLQDLIDNALRQRLDGVLLRGIQLAEASAHAFNFVLADCFEMLSQRGDRCFNLRSGQ